MVTYSDFAFFTVLGIGLNFLFLNSRFSRRKTLGLFFCTTVVLELLVWVCFRTAGMAGLAKLYTPLVHVPVLVLMFLLNRERGWKVLFQFLSSVQFCVLIQRCAGMFYLLSGEKTWVEYLSYLVVSVGIVLLILLVLRPMALSAFDQIHQGWGMLCLVLAVAYFITAYLIPGFAGDSLQATVIKTSVSILVSGVYVVFLIFCADIQSAAEDRVKAEMRLSALYSRMEAVQEAEEMLRVERHDLRHRLQTVAELVSKGERQEALDFLQASQERLDSHKAVHWCRPPVLDAVFTTYFDQARRQGIQVTADIRLPEPLPVDEADLALVFANALENAIHANQTMPVGERSLSCQVVSRPKLIFRLGNACQGKVRFGKDGLPISRQPGHGLGSRSIANFCKKYGATCQYQQEDHWFSLQVVL